MKLLGDDGRGKPWLKIDRSGRSVRLANLAEIRQALIWTGARVRGYAPLDPVPGK